VKVFRMCVVHSSQMLAFAFVLSEMSIFFSYDRCIINNTFECMQDWKRFVFHSNACLLLFCFAFVLSEMSISLSIFECMKWIGNGSQLEL